MSVLRSRPHEGIVEKEDIYWLFISILSIKIVYSSWTERVRFKRLLLKTDCETHKYSPFWRNPFYLELYQWSLHCWTSERSVITLRRKRLPAYSISFSQLDFVKLYDQEFPEEGAAEYGVNEACCLYILKNYPRNSVLGNKFIISGHLSYLNY